MTSIKYQSHKWFAKVGDQWVEIEDQERIFFKIWNEHIYRQNITEPEKDWTPSEGSVFEIEAEFEVGKAGLTVSALDIETNVVKHTIQGNQLARLKPREEKPSEPEEGKWIIKQNQFSIPLICHTTKSQYLRPTGFNKDELQSIADKLNQKELDIVDLVIDQSKMATEIWAESTKRLGEFRDYMAKTFILTRRKSDLEKTQN